MNNKEDIDQLLARYFAGEPLSLVQQKGTGHMDCGSSTGV